MGINEGMVQPFASFSCASGFFFVAFFFAAPIVVQQLVYAGDPLELVTINAGYVLVWLTVAGAVIGAVRLPSKKA